MIVQQRLFILLRPVVYVLALVSVFMLLVSSIDVDVPFLSRDIIDSVSNISKPLIPPPPLLNPLLFKSMDVAFYWLIAIKLNCNVFLSQY